MTTKPLRVVRRTEQLLSDDKRVILRYVDFVRPRRIRSVAHRILRIPERKIPGELAKIKRRFATRHRDLEGAFRDNGVKVLRHVRDTKAITEARKLLLGAYFTMEYSIEAAALFNPSIVPHPDQGDLPAGSVRFLMSLRATGEGHISSIVFRRGVIDRSGGIVFDPPPRFAYTASPVQDPALAKEPFFRKLRDHGLSDEQVLKVLAKLPDPFTAVQLKSVLQSLRKSRPVRAGLGRLSQTMLWMASANYELCFPQDCLPSEIVIFPATPHERQGMEDVRMVRFEDDGGNVHYYGTYTAFDGLRIYPMLLETSDFSTFHVATLSGRYARNKGMALFPRKIDGHYVMLSRHDGENLHLLRSKDLHVWNASTKLQTPQERWELVQVGNCGAPLKTEHGWLVVTHGMGPLRQYCIGAALLDLREPARVLGRLRRPLLVPTAAEREGYVPNVVYSYGSMIHCGRLIIPYAMSDSWTSFATVSLETLLRHLLRDGP